MVFTGVDVGVAVLVLISAILATARGFTREILSLATWAGSAAIAAYMYFYHNDLAKTYIDNELVATGVTIVGSFLVQQHLRAGHWLEAARVVHGFWRRGNVEIVSQLGKVARVDTLGQAELFLAVVVG